MRKLIQRYIEESSKVESKGNNEKMVDMPGDSDDDYSPPTSRLRPYLYGAMELSLLVGMKLWEDLKSKFFLCLEFTEDATRLVENPEQIIKGIKYSPSRSLPIVGTSFYLTAKMVTCKGLYASVRNKIGDKIMGELALKKLELDAIKLEAKAAMIALEISVDLSSKFLEETNGLSLIEKEIFENTNQLENTLPESSMVEIIDINLRIVER